MRFDSTPRIVEVTSENECRDLCFNITACKTAYFTLLISKPYCIWSTSEETLKFVNPSDVAFTKETVPIKCKLFLFNYVPLYKIAFENIIYEMS